MVITYRFKCSLCDYILVAWWEFPFVLCESWVIGDVILDKTAPTSPLQQNTIWMELNESRTGKSLFIWPILLLLCIGLYKYIKVYNPYSNTACQKCRFPHNLHVWVDDVQKQIVKTMMKTHYIPFIALQKSMLMLMKICFVYTIYIYNNIPT